MIRSACRISRHDPHFLPILLQLTAREIDYKLKSAPAVRSSAPRCGHFARRSTGMWHSWHGLRRQNWRFCGCLRLTRTFPCHTWGNVPACTLLPSGSMGIPWRTVDQVYNFPGLSRGPYLRRLVKFYGNVSETALRFSQAALFSSFLEIGTVIAGTWFDAPSVRGSGHDLGNTNEAFPSPMFFYQPSLAIRTRCQTSFRTEGKSDKPVPTRSPCSMACLV